MFIALKTFRLYVFAVAFLFLSLDQLSAQVKLAPKFMSRVPTPMEMLNNGSQGREFVFFLPMNDCITCPATAREIYVTCSRNTEITYELPALGQKTVFKVTAFKPLTIKVSGVTPMPEITASEVVSDLGIAITAKDPISVYVYNGKSVSSDGYLAIPVQSWGKDYINLGYPDFLEFRNWKGGFGFCASEDNTEVEITLRSGAYGEYATSGLNKRTEGGHRYGDRWKISLNRGQAYIVQGDGTSRGQFDLSGSRVRSNKPIGFIAYHQRTMVPVFDISNGRDHMIEMLPPVTAWGKTYISIGYSRSGKQGDLYKAVALYDNTTISWSSYDSKTKIRLKGPTTINGLKSGEVRSIPVSPEATATNSTNSAGVPGSAVFKANKPFLLMHYCCSSNWDGDPNYDPFMIYTVPKEQYTKATIFQSPTNPLYTVHWFNIIAVGDTSDPSAKLLKSIKLDDKYLYTITPQFLGNQIPGTDLYWARINVSSGPHVIVGDTPFGGDIYGYGQFDSYGWPAATAFKNLSQFDTLPPVLTRTEECGDFTYDATEIRNFKVNDTLDHVETGINQIELIDSGTVSYNYRIKLVSSDGTFISDNKIPSSKKNDKMQFRLEVIDKSKNAYARFVVVDRALNSTMDSVQWFAPRLTITPNPIDFGNVRVGRTKTLTVTIKNENDSALYIKKIRLGGNALFTLVNDSIPLEGLKIEKKSSITVKVSYTPKTEGISENQYDFDSLYVEEACAPFACFVRGRGVMPHIWVGDFDAGVVTINSTSCASEKAGIVIIRNQGTDTLTVTGIDQTKVVAPFVFDPSAASTNPKFPIVLAPGASTVLIDPCFKPLVESSYKIFIPFLSDAPPGKDKDTSVWTGVSLAPGPYIRGNDWDSVRLGVTKTLDCKMGNSGSTTVNCIDLKLLTNREYRFTNPSSKSAKGNPPFPVERNDAEILAIPVNFLPMTEGWLLDSVSADFENASTQRAKLTGYGYLEKISPSDAVFQDTTLVTQSDSSLLSGESVVIRNVSQSRWLTIRKVSLIREPNDIVNSIFSGDFKWLSNPGSDDIITTDTRLDKFGDSLVLPLIFTPGGAGKRMVRVRITSDAEPITSNPTRSHDTIVTVTAYGKVENQPSVRGFDFGNILACDNPIGNISVYDTAQLGSTNYIESVWISGGPDAVHFKVLNSPTSASPVPVKPGDNLPFQVQFFPEPNTKLKSYKAYFSVLLRGGLILTDSILATSRTVDVSIELRHDDGANSVYKEFNLGYEGAEAPMQVIGRSTEWVDAGITQFTSNILYDSREFSYVNGSVRPGNDLDNTWRIDSVKELTINGTSKSLFVKASGSNGIAKNSELLKCRFSILLSELKAQTLYANVRFSPEDNTSDSVRDECVNITTSGDSTYIFGCVIDARFIKFTQSTFSITSVIPQPARDEVLTIGYSVAIDSPVLLELVSPLGETMTTLVNSATKEGNHSVQLDAKSLSSGVYFLRMTAADQTMTKPVLISK